MPVIGRRELWLFVAVVLLWGVNWPMMKMALAELNFWVFRSYRIAAGLLWFVAFNVQRGCLSHCLAKHWGRMFVCALCNVAAWNILSAAALTMLPSGRVGVLAYTMPLWVVLLSRVLREKLPCRGSPRSASAWGASLCCSLTSFRRCAERLSRQ